MTIRLEIMVMSGADDGTLLKRSPDQNDGKHEGGGWRISVGRLDESDIRLVNDSFVSRIHANIYWRDERWWLEDCDSRNGTFITSPDNFFAEIRVRGIVPVDVGQLFRIGRTWMRIQ